VAIASPEPPASAAPPPSPAAAPTAPVLAPLPPPPTGRPTLEDDDLYRIPLPPDARRASDLGNLVVFRTGYGWTDTCDAYHDAFANSGAFTSRHDDDFVCSVMSHDESSPFRMISIQREDDGGTSVKLFR
jgi:hypothetical protein